jgi:hypothetical protein
MCVTAWGRNHNVADAQKDLEAVNKRQPCERFLSLRLDRLLDTGRDRTNSPHPYRLRLHIWKECWRWHARWTPVGRISDDCRVSGAGIHHDMVIQVHRLAERIADSTQRPSVFLVQQAAWIGVASSALGILLSMLVILFEVAQLLIYFLRAPQAGVPVIQTTGGGQASWVSAADMMNLVALVLTTFGEFTVLTFSLWLLFRTTFSSAEYPHASDGE